MKVITITIKNLQKKIPIHPQRIRRAVLKTLFIQGVKKSGEITICFVNDLTIKELNLMYLGSDTSTDVIAFDLSDSRDEFCADLAISTDTAIRNARIFKTTPLYEVYLYIVHGILHLLGYNDKTEKQRIIMERKTSQLLYTLYPVPCTLYPVHKKYVHS